MHRNNDLHYPNDHESIRKTFWNGIYNGEQYEWNDKGWKLAVKRACGDLMARTLTPKPSTDGEPKKSLAEQLCGEAEQTGRTPFLEHLGKGFDQKRLWKNEDEFDVWHHDACGIVWAILRDLYTNRDESPVQYGKAQKIVNMTLKYMYCLEGAETYEDNFRYCHMALDSFTLEWFKRNVCNRKTVCKGKVGPWSNMPYSEADEKGCYPYRFYVKAIRDHFDHAFSGPYAGLTPFQAEFYIWPEIQLHLAAEAVLFQLQETALDEETANLPEEERKKRIAKEKQEIQAMRITEKLEKMQTAVGNHLTSLKSVLSTSR